MLIKDLNESFCFIEFSDKEDYNLKIRIANWLSIYVDNYKFHPQFRAGIWDGKKYFWKMIEDNKMLFPKGLLSSISTKLKKENISFEYQPVKPKKEVIFNKEEFNTFIKKLNLPFNPYDYQKEAFIKCIKEKRKVCVMATGSGKSLTIYLLMRYFQFKGLKGLLIVPSVSLVQQMSSDFLSYNMKKEDYQKMVHLISAGLPKHFNKDITISTWQSLYKNSELFNSLDYIIVDEAHGVKSNVFENIIIPSAINCGYRFGFTGTLPESFAERMTIVACLGKTEKIITPQGLIERGLATPVEIEMIFINYNNEDKKLVKRMKYQDEIKFIESHNFRNNMIAKIALKVSKKGNTIVLFNTKKHGKLLLENIIRNKFNKNNIYLIDKLTPKYIKDSYEVFKENFKENKDITIYFNGKIDKLKIKKVIQDEEFINSFKSLEDLDIYFIYGDIDKNQREKIRQLLEKKKSAILVASYGTLSTGVNIKRIHNIILSATTKSFIRLNQSIGRGMRLHNEKEKIKIWDITDDFSKLLSNGKRQNLNYALKQSNERIRQYLENGYPINEREFELN